LWWVPSRKGGFEVKTFYQALSVNGIIAFPWKSIWRTKAPPRVAFFVWTAARGKILTLDNLRRRGMVVVNRCWLCESDGKSVDHFFIVGLQGLCGILSLLDLGFAGSCLAQ
jgi:hypothetical protein